MGYLGQTVKGISWIGALRGVTRGLSFVRVLILARLLTPSQFGLFGVASFMLALVEVLTETGINIFLVQREGTIDKYLSSAWIVSIIRGFVIFLFIVISSPIVAGFFNAQDALGLLLLISIVPLVRGFINPSIVLFQKELNFNREFYFRGVVLTFEVLVSIVLVYLLKSPAGLVIGLISSAFLEVVLSFAIVKPRPSFQFEKIRVFEVIHTGKWVTMSTIFNYLYQNVDDMVVVRILNTTSLGLYQMAYKIAMLPITEVADVIARVTFPVYSKISGDATRLKSAFYKTVGATFLFSLPIVVMFIVFPEQIVLLILGDKWIGSVGAFQVLVFFGLARAITSPALILLLSLKRQDIVAKISMLTFLLMGITIIPFVIMWGIVGAGISSVIASVIVLPVAYYFALKYFSQPKI